MPQASDADSITARVCRFAAGLTLDDIPGEVRLKAKLHILDTIGCGIAGAGSMLAQSMLAFVGLEHGSGRVPVFGTSHRFGPATAAFANAAAMNALDFDDGFEVDGKGMGHPGASIVAAASSAPFIAAISGGKLLTAIVAGYEINNRLIRAMQPSIERFRQVYGVCQHQTIGSAVAHAAALGSNAVALENSVGLAGTLSNVPSLRKYNFDAPPLISFKDFNAPAAEAGVRAVQLNDCGIVGSKRVLDGSGGLWRMLGSDSFMPEYLTEDLGARWELLGSSIKPYAACRWMHTAMEAFETLLAGNGLRPEDIEAVTVHTSAALARDFMDPMPKTMVDAQFSFPYALAALALGVGPASKWYDTQTMSRSDIYDFAQCVRAEIDPEIEQRMGGALRRPAGRVSILANGTQISSPLIEFALGSRERPLSDAAINQKFESNAAPVLGTVLASELRERLLDIEAEGDISALLELATVN